MRIQAHIQTHIRSYAHMQAHIHAAISKNGREVLGHLVLLYNSRCKGRYRSG